jgi:acyl-CoA synthetase (AMP-forming)/AMP-acid ligase II
MVCHDLRAPLRTMSGYSSVLLEDYGPVLGAEGRAYAEKIQAAGEQMSQLIEALLRLPPLSRVEVSPQPVDLGAEATAIAAELQVAEPWRQVRFTIQQPAWAMADRTLIRTVLENLLGNSWKFTAGGQASRDLVHATTQLYAAAEPVDDGDPPRRHEIACISYTSGTTGPSKGVLVPWGRFWPNEMWLYMAPDDVYYCPFPVFHMSGMLPLAWLGFPGGQVVLRHSFKTSAFWGDVRAYGCTATALIPAMMNWLIDSPERPDDLDNPLRYVGGAPVVPRVDQFEARFGVKMRTTFGGSSTSMTTRCPMARSAS